VTILLPRSAALVRSLRAALLGTFVLFAAVTTAQAADDALQRPHWSVELKGGSFYPAIDFWKDFYGSDHTWQVSGAVGYKVLRWAEIGIEGGSIQDSGMGYGPTSGTLTGKVDYQLFPVHAYVLVRGIFSEDQWIVPYAGGGYTRIYYRERIEGQETVRGSVDGYHGRAGLQLLLDDLDRKSADNLYMSFGILHTYLLFEVQLTKTMVDTASLGSVDLGGFSYLGGLLFEF